MNKYTTPFFIEELEVSDLTVSLLYDDFGNVYIAFIPEVPEFIYRVSQIYPILCGISEHLWKINPILLKPY